MKTIHQRIEALTNYYEKNNPALVIYSYENLPYILVGEKEDGEFYSFSIYVTDKHTGLKYGYIGQPIMKMHRQDSEQPIFTSLAVAAYNSLKD